jgi:hypothetical protein
MNPLAGWKSIPRAFIVTTRRGNAAGRASPEKRLDNTSGTEGMVFAISVKI